jgi:hypothetical protein
MAKIEAVELIQAGCPDHRSPSIACPSHETIIRNMLDAIAMDRAQCRLPLDASLALEGFDT